MKIVLLVPNWLGDIVMALPAIRDVRRHFAAAHLTAAVRPSVAKLFRAVPDIDDVLTLSGTRGDTARLRRGQFDVAILLPNSFRSAWIAWRGGIPQRWGYRSDFRRMLLTRSVSRPKPRVPFPEYYQELVRRLGIDTGPLTPHLVLPPAIVAASRRLLEERGWDNSRPLIGIAPGAAFGHAKRWPARRFAAVIASARQELDAVCVLLGRDSDRDATQEIEETLGSERDLVINLVGQTELLMFMGVIGHCSALVANDSGALHVAAAMGVPVVAIYGPTTERYSRPLTSVEGAAHRVATVSTEVWCRPCWLRECPIDHRCMKRIPPERVYASLRQLLREEANA
jgi:heptosyltransferase-2